MAANWAAIARHEHLSGSSLPARVWKTLLDVAAPANENNAGGQTFLSLPGALDDGRCLAVLLAEAVLQAGFLVASQPCE
jgi:hypothetical protein